MHHALPSCRQEGRDTCSWLWPSILSHVASRHDAFPVTFIPLLTLQEYDIYWEFAHYASESPSCFSANLCLCHNQPLTLLWLHMLFIRRLAACGLD